MIEVQVTGQRDGGRCAFCHDEVAPRKGATCDGCGVRLHTHCQAELKTCPTPGCAVRPRAAAPLRSRRESSLVINGLALLAALGVVLLVVLKVAFDQHLRGERRARAAQERLAAERREDEARRAVERELARLRAEREEAARRAAEARRAEEARAAEEARLLAERQRAELAARELEERAAAERRRVTSEAAVRELAPLLLEALARGDRAALAGLASPGAVDTALSLPLDWSSATVLGAAGADHAGIAALSVQFIRRGDRPLSYRLRFRQEGEPPAWVFFEMR